MCEREIKIKEKWGPIESQPDDKLKQVAKDIYNGLVFTDRHCKGHEIQSRFMVLMFMGPIFMSLRMLNKEDSQKVWEYYEKYKNIRETADNF